jgi:nitric oxide reductase subunit B
VVAPNVAIVFVCGMAVLIFMSVQAYRYAPPIPEHVFDTAGKIIFSKTDIEAGQQVFLKYALMQNGSIWGHGSYLGPDFSAQYLHGLSIDTGKAIAKQEGIDLSSLNAVQQHALIDARIAGLLKENRYDPLSKELTFTDPEKVSYQRQLRVWNDYFLHPEDNAGLPTKYIHDPGEIRRLTAFFAWTAWASVANRPDKPYSYTNNFPYDPVVGNRLTADALLWSGLSVAMLLAGLALVLFTFGRFDYLGWKGDRSDFHPHMLPGGATAGQKAVIKYCLVVSLLFLAQVSIGGALAHYRAEPGNFYGVDLAQYLPSNILRTWHLQLALFWIATAYVAGGLLLASSLGQDEPRGQAAGIFFRQHHQFYSRGYLALLDHPPVGGRFFRTVCDRSGCRHLLPAGCGSPHQCGAGHLYGCHPFSVRRHHRNRSPLVLDRAGKFYNGPGSHVLCARSGTAHPADA